MDLREDIQPLTVFRNQSTQMMRQLHETQRPIILTVNGRAEAVVMDPKAFERMRDLAALASEKEGLRQGEEDIAMNRTKPVAEALEEIRAACGLQS